MSEQKEIIRGSIADLLEENDIILDNDVDANTLTFQRTPSTLSTLTSDSLEKSKEKAGKIMKSLLRLYMSDGFISKNEYVQAKNNTNSMTLGKILNQMVVSDRAIQILMENIELGDVNPKLFDALANLQRTFLEIVRTQTNYISMAEEEYRKISVDKDTESTPITTAQEEAGGGIRSSNPKDLMRLIRTACDKDNDKNV